MGVVTYSLASDGGKKLSQHFTLGEFACRDASDEVKVDTRLVELLENIRMRFDAPLTITSAYRTPEYNRRVGGASASQHLYGKAADVRLAGVSCRSVADCAEALGAGGIGLYEYEGGFTHVDVRDGRSRWLQSSKNGSAVSVSGFEPAETEEIGADKGKEAKALSGNKPSAWAEEAALWALEEGFIRGDETGNPQWQAPLTREQLAVILRRLYESLKG